MTALLLALLMAVPVNPCVLLARRCWALSTQCDNGATPHRFAVCARTRGCINRYELKCGPWW